MPTILDESQPLEPWEEALMAPFSNPVLPKTPVQPALFDWPPKPEPRLEFWGTFPTVPTLTFESFTRAIDNMRIRARYTTHAFNFFVKGFGLGG